ncbi:MAG: response regulator [Ignavibacteriaceae bacterium]|jgi:DNA-binding response OmpR family regulator|nr:response regulator [Ignavibacteriaceae bacterium]
MESILIVDDDVNLCNFLSDELSAVGYETNYLTDGENVAEFLKENKTDLILLDLNMPGKNGFNVQSEINIQPGIKPKIIILTAHSDVKSAIESARLGASDFLCKPYNFNELLSTIRKVIQKKN